MTNEKVTDLTYLKDISMGDENMVMEMIEVFLEGYDEALTEMHQLYDGESWEALRARAHKFKPNLAYMGIEMGMEKIQQLEDDAKNENPDDAIQNRISNLRSICEQASQELQQELQKMNAS